MQGKKWSPRPTCNQGLCGNTHSKGSFPKNEPSQRKAYRLLWLVLKHKSHRIDSYKYATLFVMPSNTTSRQQQVQVPERISEYLFVYSSQDILFNSLFVIEFNSAWM